MTNDNKVKNIAWSRTALCFGWNPKTQQYTKQGQNCWSSEEADIHEYTVTIMTYMVGLTALYMFYTLAKRQGNSAGASGKALSAFGLIQVILSLFLIFSTAWNYGLGFFFAATAAIYAGVSGNHESALLSAFLNFVSFFQTVGTLLAIGSWTFWNADGTPSLPGIQGGVSGAAGSISGRFVPMIDSYTQDDCVSYYAMSHAYIVRDVFHRCDANQYLQLLRVMTMFISMTASVLAIVSFSIIGNKFYSKSVAPIY